MADNYADLGTITSKWMRKPDWSKSVDTTYDLAIREFLQSRGTAIEMYNPTGKYPPIGMKYGHVSLDKQEEYEIIDFFADREGQLKKFWIPTWKNQMTLTETIMIGSPAFRIANKGYNLIHTGYHRVLFELRNGDFITRKISAVAVLDDTEEQLTVETVFDRTILVSDIVLICFLLLCRFNSDKLLVKYITDTVSDVSFEVKELVQEYP